MKIKRENQSAMRHFFSNLFLNVFKEMIIYKDRDKTIMYLIPFRPLFEIVQNICLSNKLSIRLQIVNR